MLALRTGGDACSPSTKSQSLFQFSGFKITGVTLKPGVLSNQDCFDGIRMESHSRRGP